MPIPDSLPVPGELQLGVDGSRSSYLSLRASRDTTPSSGASIGDLILGAGAGGEPQWWNGTAWKTMATQAFVTGIAAGTTYNVLANGLVADGATDNVNALLALIATVKAAGGGTIFFPAGNYNFTIHYDGGLSPANRSIYLRDQGQMNIIFAGEGPASRLIWGGNAGQGGGGGGAAHFFYLRGQTSHVYFRDMKILQTDLTNPDPGAEQHHLVRVHADVTGNTQHIGFKNVHFGLIKGDAINCSGGFNTNTIKANYAGSSGSGAVPSLSNLVPTGLLPGEGMRVCVDFSADWNGGSFTFTGKEPNGRGITETISKLNAIGADTVAGYREFAEVTDITYSGGAAGTANIGYTYCVNYVDIEGCRFNGFDRAGSFQGYGYRSAIGVQRLSHYIRVVRNWMTGSDDQLIDFEPTGNGPLGPWIIEYNTIIALAAATNGGADTCCSFFGNANKFPCERSSISHNSFVGGGVIGGKLRACDLVGNYMWVYEDARLLFQFTDRMEDVRFQGNWVEAITPGVGVVSAPPLSIIGGGSATVPDSPDGLLVLDNIFHWYCLSGNDKQPCIRITAGNNTTIARNLCVNFGTAATVDVAAIKIEDAAIAVKNLRIMDNTIEAGRGGGSLQRGVDNPTAPSTAWTNYTVRGNCGTGITAEGVHVKAVGAGSYVNPPAVYGNTFSGATTNVSLDAGVVALVGGNGGAAAGVYTGAAVDPATDTELDNVGVGSAYQSTGAGGDMYLKTAAGSAGWKKVTHA